MPFIPALLIGAGFLGNLLLVVLLLGDVTAPLAAAAVLALGGGALILAGLMLMEPRRDHEAGHPR
ncbi:hypothetical protein [Roseomonas sp. CAU 1739]|uniref:hypothetical protein n=1 Tax=Roseomonas sp. CAU 1739 TaxID=3140364 RepID=UPI00325B571C